MTIPSKLPDSGTSIFTVMSALANEYQAINLGQGFPDFDCDEVLKQRVNAYLQAGKNQYAPLAGVLELRERLSIKLQQMHAVTVNPATDICVTAGATQALFTAITAYVQQSDEVIIIEPAYDSYKPSILIAGGIPKVYTLTYPDYSIDWNVFSDLITPKTRMIIINTPHNPTGTILRAADMQALESLVAGTDIIVLSDEVYEHLIYDGEIHQSVLKYPKLAQQSLAVYSFGKTFHATGWKMGYCVGPEYLIKAFKAVHQWNVFCVNSFVQYALADHLKTPAFYDNLPSFFQQKRDLLTTALADTPLNALIAKGTYFQLYDYSAISDSKDTDFAKYLTQEIGVAVIPISPFCSSPIKDKVVRLCFAKQDQTLLAAAERLQRLS